MSPLTCATLGQLWKERVLEQHVYLGDERRIEAMTMKSKNGDPVFLRALHGFVVLREEEPEFIQPLEMEADFWVGVSVLGYAATLEGEEGLFVQTGHWFDNLVNYHLVKIDHIRSLEFRSNPAFRSGEPCMWLSAENYDYAMMCSFSFFENLWHLTLAGYLASPCKPTSLSQSFPSWWPQQEQSIWVRLQAAERFAALPAIRRHMATNDTWHYPNLPALRTSMPALAPLHHGSNLPRAPANGKRTFGDPGHPGDAGNGSSMTDDERRRQTKRLCPEDPDRLNQVMRTCLSLSGVSRDTLAMDEQTNEMQPSLKSSVNNGYTNVWVLGEPTEPNGSLKENPAAGAKSRSSTVPAMLEDTPPPAGKQRRPRRGRTDRVNP
ncbi:hypothetical protein FRC10_009306 [Ceratobasidium sp. 414]|nr:hypothetical protein FRC10_009306 [Ceratobasidium sp. 414]